MAPRRHSCLSKVRSTRSTPPVDPSVEEERAHLLRGSVAVNFGYCDRRDACVDHRELAPLVAQDLGSEVNLCTVAGVAERAQYCVQRRPDTDPVERAAAQKLERVGVHSSPSASSLRRRWRSSPERARSICLPLRSSWIARTQAL